MPPERLDGETPKNRRVEQLADNFAGSRPAGALAHVSTNCCGAWRRPGRLAKRDGGQAGDVGPGLEVAD